MAVIVSGLCAACMLQGFSGESRHGAKRSARGDGVRIQRWPMGQGLTHRGCCARGPRGTPMRTRTVPPPAEPPHVHDVTRRLPPPLAQMCVAVGRWLLIVPCMHLAIPSTIRSRTALPGRPSRRWCTPRKTVSPLVYSQEGRLAAGVIRPPRLWREPSASQNGGCWAEAPPRTPPRANPADLSCRRAHSCM